PQLPCRISRSLSAQKLETGLMAKDAGSKTPKRPAARGDSEASVRAEIERTDRELVKLANQRAKLY
ncbi:MAG: hypothetical protein ACREJM_16080, partial [Candidatus Saccharimonadales bacterium]